MSAEAETSYMYVGSFTEGPEGGGPGVGIFTWEPSSGLLEPAGTLSGVRQPAFLAAHPSLPLIYALDRADDDTSAVATLSRQPDGQLRVEASEPTLGVNACHILVSEPADTLFCSHYGSGEISVHDLDPSGVVSPRRQVLEAKADSRKGRVPRAHSVLAGRAARVFVADLGLDEVRAYERSGSTGRYELVQVVELARGTGPRHMVHLAGGRIAVAGELNSTITVLGVSENGDLTLISQIPSMVGPTPELNHPSEIIVSPKGDLLIIGNRGADVLSVFTLGGGGVTPLRDVPTEGHWPRHFIAVGTRLYLANQKANHIVDFEFDEENVLKPSGRAVSIMSPTFLLPMASSSVG